jgi:putative protein-disulfide isomerase
MEQHKTVLYYVYDPMCAWCWGYKPTWDRLQQSIDKDVEVIYVLGGLAPDTDQPMPIEMREQIASYWKKIESYLGTRFNYDFWRENIPRRSTYPACRAAMAARRQGAERKMLQAIQHAYYLEAKNPSDDTILLNIAKELGLNFARFEHDFYAHKTEQALMSEIDFARSIGGNSFPSLFIKIDNDTHELPLDYKSAHATATKINQFMAKE